MSTRPFLHLALSAGLLGGGVAATMWILRTRPPAAEVELPGPRPVPVGTARVERREVPRPIQGVGTLSAWREAVLASEVGGQVVSVLEGLRDGAAIDAGALLLVVDATGIRAELAAQARAVELATVRKEAAVIERARADAGVALAREGLGLAEEDEARWRGLVERGRAEQLRLDTAAGQRVAAALRVEDALARVDAADAARRAAEVEERLAVDRRKVLETRLAKTEVRAPFSGRFVAPQDRIPTVGTVLAPLEPLGRLADVTRMRLVSEVHEDDAAALRIGAPAAAAPGSRRGVLLEGAVSAIGSEVDPQTRSLRIESTFRGGAFPGVGDGAAALPIGTFARVEIEGEPLRDALWIDDRWIGFREGQAVVFVVEGWSAEGLGRVRVQPVEFLAGLWQGGRIIVSGLQVGDELATTRLELLGEGALVSRGEGER